MQIGVQHYNDHILRKLNRKCYTRHTIEAIRMLKQCGFKVVVHLMPDLPNSSIELDKWMFDQSIENPDLQFDDVKVYPTAVLKSERPDRIVRSKIADWYNAGTYLPYSEKNLEDLINVLLYYKKKIQPWVRIERLVRDFPSTSMTAGYKRMGNLRQVIHDRMKKTGDKCHCIRCMEIKDMEFDNLTPYLVVRKYNASQGTEYHITVEAHKMNKFQKMNYYWFLFVSWILFIITGKWRYWSGDLESYVGLFGFLRLRNDPNPGGDIISEINNCGLIREVHVYGQSLGVGTDSIGSQHRGYGQLMMKTAENICSELGFNKIAVIAGVGARDYYRKKCGYYLGETYMLKDLKKVHHENMIFIIAMLFIFISLFYYYFI
jgi:histone acetyltransferase (RNA polymerase elongator complex component)